MENRVGTNAFWAKRLCTGCAGRIQEGYHSGHYPWLPIVFARRHNCISQNVNLPVVPVAWWLVANTPIVCGSTSPFVMMANDLEETSQCVSWNFHHHFVPEFSHMPYLYKCLPVNSPCLMFASSILQLEAYVLVCWIANLADELPIVPG